MIATFGLAILDSFWGRGQTRRMNGNLMPYLLFIWSIQRVHAERAAIVATLEPFVAAILAWTWFGQTLTMLQIAGGVLIMVAVATLQLKSAPTPQNHP